MLRPQIARGPMRGAVSIRRLHAGRNRTALDTAGELGADATVVLGDGNDAEELQAEGPHVKLAVAPR